MHEAVGDAWQTSGMPLSRFSAPTREWFTNAFERPTPVQESAWAAIARGEHVLCVAPTGSGKTLAAFLWALDSLAVGQDPAMGTRVVYVSPLKALGVDVERNLRTPLAGIRAAAERLGISFGQVSVGVRSGDTTPRERAALRRRPPDILITTPESLYLMLTGSARETLTGVGTVIVDEIHAVAGSKRGSHLALTLERLDALTGTDVQRVALSATVRPVERIAAFLGGDRPVTVVDPPAHKHWDVTVRTAVPDLGDTGNLAESPGGSIWPFVERQVYDRISQARSTLVFTNSRRAAERLTGKLNDLWAEEHDPGSLPEHSHTPPAQLMAPVDTVRGAPAIIARAHHGSVSKEARAEIEQALKAGELRCVVATSSLELGIDMGAIGRVIQAGAPPSIASALQRIGRAGHDVGATSAGEVFPLHRGDLAPAVAATEAMLAGRIEELHVPRHPLDVLAQQTVAAATAADQGLDVDAWFATLTRAYPYAGLDRALFDSVVELLTGCYPSADFGQLRARLSLGDDGRLHPLRGSLRLATTSGGTIPDRGLFGVFLTGDEKGPRRVGELDEEMVFETRVGDVFTLGASAWRVEGITQDRVLVSPAPGRSGRLPFWRGDEEGRPAELGAAIGALHREVARDPARLERAYIDQFTRDNLAGYLEEQRQATGVIPDERTVVLERFRDEVGDWRVVIHSPLGRRVLGAWALIMTDVLSREAGVDVRPQATDDGVVLRLPDCAAANRLAELIVPGPDEVASLVIDAVGGSAVFAARFRECAARALLLPRLSPGKRAPLWQQRLRAMQLLELARHHPRFPIIIETVREVTQDVYDLPGVESLIRGLRSGGVRLVEVVTERPSPFAAAILFRYPDAFMYEGDIPLAQRRAALLSLDPDLLAAALGTLDLRDLLDADCVTEVVRELQRTSRPARTVEDLVDLLRAVGPVPLDALGERLAGLDLESAIAGAGARVAVIAIAERDHLAAAADLPLLHEALGTSTPQTRVSAEGRDPLTQLVARYARTHGPFTASDVAAAFGIAADTVSVVLARETASRRLIPGRFTPGIIEPEFIDPDVLRRVRGRSLARARAELQPVSGSGFCRFLAAAHQVDDPPDSNPDEVLFALQRLAGAFLPASAWESHVLPARLKGYLPAHLDTLLAEGEVVVRIRGNVGANDPLVALVPAADVDMLPPVDPPSEQVAAIAAALAEGDGTTASLEGTQAERLEALWTAAEAGAIAPSSFAPVRARIGGSSRGAHRAARPVQRRRARLPRSALGLARPSVEAAGRWYRVRDPRPDTALALASAWLERWGVVTRGGVTADGVPGGFAAAYRLLSELEAAGKVLRGYLVEGLGAAQFSTAEVIDQVRSFADSPEASSWPSGIAHPAPIVLAALDPANPYGSILPWPEHPTARPSRSAGALVVVADGLCLAHVTRGGRQLTLFDSQMNRADRAQLVTEALIAAARAKRIERLRIEEIDGERVGASELEPAMRHAGARISPKGLIIEG